MAIIMGTCIFCENPLDGSREHIIPSAIGGRKASTALVCSEHNNSLGSTIDKALTEQLSVISNLLKIKTGRTGKKRDPPKIYNLTNDKGYKVQLEPGGQLVRSVAITTENETAHGTNFSISADATKPHQLEDALNGLLRKWDRSRDELQHIRAQLVRSDDTTEIVFHIGGVEQARAIAKMALLFFASKIRTSHVREAPFHRIRNFIADGSGSMLDFFRHGYQTELFRDENELLPNTLPSHRLIISASPITQTVIGFVDLYGALRYSILLAEEWSEDPVTFAYSLNPITGETHEKKDFPPVAISAYDFRNRDNQADMLQQGVKRLLTYAHARRSHLEIPHLIDVAINTELGIPDGRVLTADDIDQLSRSIAELFLSSQYRTTYKKEIDVAKLLGWATTESEDDES